METYKNQLKNNMNTNGGGLATNITGKFESNRHAIARSEKFTFGEVVAELKKKKNGGLIISAAELLEIYRSNFGEPEWHHAGKMPKAYGGGMKKTYFLNEVPTFDQVNEWREIYEIKNFEKKLEAEIEQKRQIAKEKFIKKYGEFFHRETERPKYSVTTKTEMNGKFGWFDVLPYHSYKLTEYYSGYSFKSLKSLNKFLSL